jgi:predicted DsbA family dithiol-disulfide isomerase
VDKMVLYGGNHVGVGLDLGFGPGASPETAARVRALGARHSIDFGAATGRTGPSRNAHKLAAQVLHHRGPEAQGQVLEALFRGHFEGAGDISDAAWLVGIGTTVGGLAPSDVQGVLLNDVAGWVVDEEVRAGQAHDGVEAVPCVTVQGRYRLGGYQDEAVFEDVFDKVSRDWQLHTGDVTEPD